MKKELLFTLLILVLFTAGCVTQQTTSQITKENSLEKVIVTKIIDGDTFVVQGGIHVRLLGIDTPEKGKYYWQEAKDYLESRTYLKEVFLEKGVEDKDQYGRLLRWIWLNNSLINLELVQKGYAIARFYGDSKYQQEIQLAEQQAIQEKIGLWGQDEVDTITVNTENSSSVQQTKSNSDCSALGCPDGTVFVGSKNSDKYHKCSCSYASRIKKENIVCFSSEQEAEDRGYSPSSCG